jgi:hypothetical protein
MACLVVRGASPSTAHHVTHDSVSLSGAEQERILDFKKGCCLDPGSRQYVYNETRLQSSKVRNDARVDGKGAGRGSTYPYDHPKHALTTTLPLHDPLNLVSSASARCSGRGGRVPFLE